MSSKAGEYGHGDATFQAVGGETGVFKLVNTFYDIMDSATEAIKIRAMHGDDLSVSRDKLFRFLCGWMGGPKLFRERYGAIDIVSAHSHFAVDKSDRDAWLWAMSEAIKTQGYPQPLADYLLKQLTVPADRILAKHLAQQQSQQ